MTICDGGYRTTFAQALWHPIKQPWTTPPVDLGVLRIAVLQAIYPVAGPTFGVGYGNDFDYFRKFAEDYRIREILKNASPGCQ
ncbi:MAG TPA: hypothetical protein VHZ52_00480 [Acidobacteriaceae bacterium]|jgi:hypothetical protein|nr:hypothetical protein [Acidobacteriaceae bacterium]